MANALAILPPSLIARAGVQSYNLGSVFEAPGAIFRRGDFLQKVTTGTITNVAPTGSISAVVPTAAPTVSSTGSAVSGTPITYYYAYYTYTNSGGSIESQPSPEFLIVNASGYKATVTVPVAGSPAAGQYFNLYVGLYPGTEVQQVAATALGSAATVPVPLTNSVGANRLTAGGTAVSAATVFGLAVDDYDVTYAPKSPVQFDNRSPFGIDTSTPPLGSYEQYQTKVVPLSAGLQFEMSLLQAWTPGLLYTTCGVSYQTAYNTFAADNTASTAFLTIQGKVGGNTFNPTYDDQGGFLDTGARVIVSVTTTSVLIL
jgi:hypothetical protein